MPKSIEEITKQLQTYVEVRTEIVRICKAKIIGCGMVVQIWTNETISNEIANQIVNAAKPYPIVFKFNPQ